MSYDLRQAEDVPAEVDQVLLGATHVHEVAVEGSAATEIDHAIRFARRVAREFDGAVLDQQTGEVWTRSTSRQVARTTRQDRVGVVTLSWYCTAAGIGAATPADFVDAARHLPEAMPRRFGDFEPLQGRFDEVGVAGFTRAWQDSRMLFSCAGALPCLGADLSSPPGAGDRYWSASATFLAEPLAEAGWRVALRRYFVTLADAVPAFCATATLTRGHVWNGRTAGADAETESRHSPLRRGEWLGLPLAPTWWTWLGREYGELVADLPAEVSRRTEEGVLCELSAFPRPADELPPLRQWLPPTAFSKLAPNPFRSQPHPLRRGRLAPAALGSRA